jgi:hypothetical protein
MAKNLPALNPIAQPDRAAFQDLAVGKGDRLQRDGHAGLVVAEIEDAGRAFGALDGRENSRAYLVDEAGAQKGSVRDPAAIHLQAIDAELAVQDVEGRRKVEIARTGENVRHAILAQTPKMGRRDLSVSTTIMGSPPTSLRPHAILPCGSSTMP